MSRDYRLYLDDMRESCEKVLRYTRDLAFDQFVHDEKTFDAVVRNLEIIGEAAKHVPSEVRTRYPDVEWPKIAGLRDVVVHSTLAWMRIFYGILFGIGFPCFSTKCCAS